MANESLVNKCNKIWLTDDWAYYCHDCSLQEFIVICFDCYEKSKHFGHEVETIYCEKGVLCNCGHKTKMKSNGFCSKHRIENESGGFSDAIIPSLSSNKLRDLTEFNHLNEVSEHSFERNLILKYFDRSIVNKLDIKVKKIYEITKISTKFSNSCFENMRRMLLWYTINNKEANSLSKILKNGIKYENGKMGRCLYFRDRINRVFKYENRDFGLYFLCDVAVGSMYRTCCRNQFRDIPSGYDSVKGVGKLTPEKNKSDIIGNQIIVPTGKTVPNKSVGRTEFDINQFVVLDKNQVIIRYLIQYSK